MNVFVTVGTDHHPFERLMDWVDRWAASHREARVVVQHGTSRAPKVSLAVPLCSASDMRGYFDGADVVVCAGGPGTIMDARAAGRKPIVVPRRRHLGEHVDDHQLEFARYTGRAGVVVVVESEDDFESALGIALADRAAYRFEPEDEPTPEGILRFGSLVDRLMWPSG
ncbi:MAG: glycosyltransferase [Acidimicrobiales bacterium]